MPTVINLAEHARNRAVLHSKVACLRDLGTRFGSEYDLVEYDPDSESVVAAVKFVDEDGNIVADVMKDIHGKCVLGFGEELYEKIGLAVAVRMLAQRGILYALCLRA